MKLLYLVSIFVTCLSCIEFGQSLICVEENKNSGKISESYNGNNIDLKCRIIKAPMDSYIRIDVKELHLNNMACSEVYIEISVSGIEEVFMFCEGNQNRKPIIALDDVNITSSLRGTGPNWRRIGSSFSIDYSIESLVCDQKNNFRCSDHFCIHDYQVCDGVKDCDDGADEVGCETVVKAIKGVNASRENAIGWLKNQRSGWGRNTHRAITSLYLAGDWNFNGDLDEELVVKQLELQTSVALLRNSTDLLSVSELSMFVNALSATCHNPRNFFGYDLLQLISDQLASSKSPCPGSYLTLCNANWTFSESNVRSLLKILHERSEYPFITEFIRDGSPLLKIQGDVYHHHATTYLINITDKTARNGQIYIYDNLEEAVKIRLDLGNAKMIQRIEAVLRDVKALATMALTCIKNKMKVFEDVGDSTKIYNETIHKFISSQKPDGSFGNVYTTALVTQALLSSGQEVNSLWNLTSTVKYLMQQQNASTDFLSTYLTLPIFNDKSLVKLSAVNCSTHRYNNHDDITDMTGKLGGKSVVQYSLYIGDLKDVVHTIYLRVPENSLAYDVMRMAQVADPKYKFLHRNDAGYVYVYEIAGITNDPEALKFWILHTKDSNHDSKLHHHTKSPDKLIMKDGEHLIMWFKTVDM